MSTDDEGDEIVISSDEEMMTALTALGGDLIKLYVRCKSPTAKAPEMITATNIPEVEVGE